MYRTQSRIKPPAMPFIGSRAILSAIAATLAAVAALASRADAGSGDYDLSVCPSFAARQVFASAACKSEKVAIRRGDGKKAHGVYYSENGGIVIPPGRMIEFGGSGKCMDPRLPAPGIGEPVQFVNVKKLIHRKLRTTYDNLMLRYSQDDPAVLRNNPQHLVWALRTAGKEDTFAGNLSESQYALLDDCMGRRDGFRRFHRKEMRRKGRDKSAKRSAPPSISVGEVSYDATELRNSERGNRLVQEHMDSLIAMGRNARMSADCDLRYGEIDDGLYSDIISGGLSYKARIVNVSGEEKTFNALEYAAQVGNGANGTQRQRITMCPPPEIIVIVIESGPVCDDPEDRRKRPDKKDEEKDEEPDNPPEPQPPEPPRPPVLPPEPPEPPELPESPEPPDPPVPPPKPDFDEPVPTNVVTSWTVPIVTVIDLQYDAHSATGMMTVKIGSCTVKKARKWLSKNWAELLFAESHYLVSKAEDIREIAKTIPRDAEYEATEMPNKGNTIFIRFIVRKKAEHTHGNFTDLVRRNPQPRTRQRFSPPPNVKSRRLQSTNQIVAK